MRRRGHHARGNRQLGLNERAGRLHSSTFVLARPARAIRYTMTTPAGSFAYDSPAARAIIAALTAGQPAGTGDLRTLLTLCAAGDIMPAAPGSLASTSGPAASIQAPSCWPARRGQSAIR